MPESPLIRRIQTYAFNHGCDMDEATYKVMLETAWNLKPSDKEGLFDRLFGEVGNGSIERQ